MSHEENPMENDELDGELALRAQLVWDTVPDDKIVGWAEKLGLHGYSPEVAEMEQMQALRRRLELAPLAEELVLLTLLTAEILSTAMLIDRADKGEAKTLDLEDTDETSAFLLAGVTAVLTSLVDMQSVIIPAEEEEES